MKRYGISLKYKHKEILSIEQNKPFIESDFKICFYTINPKG